MARYKVETHVVSLINPYFIMLCKIFGLAFGLV